MTVLPKKTINFHKLNFFASIECNSTLKMRIVAIDQNVRKLKRWRDSVGRGPGYLSKGCETLLRLPMRECVLLCPSERHVMLFSILGLSSLSYMMMVAQPDERHANKTASVMEWYERHRAYSIWLKRRFKKLNLFKIQNS